MHVACVERSTGQLTAELDSDKFWCINCKRVGQASWDHLCPKFMERRKQLEDTDPESTYRFYPSQDVVRVTL